MKNLVNRVQQELSKLQSTLQKEGQDLLKRFKNLDLVDNFESKKKEIETVIEKNLKKIEPAYKKLLTQVSANAKRAGIDLEKIEKELRKKAKVATKKIELKKRDAKSAKKKVQSKIKSVQKTIVKKVEASVAKPARKKPTVAPKKSTKNSPQGPSH